jgi:hypothetical protein
MDNKTLPGANFCTTSGLLTATGAETVYDTTVTINYVINGKIATKTAVTDGATPTTDHVSGSAITLTASKARTVVWGLVAGGTVKVIAGDIVDWNGTAFDVAPSFPSIPDDFVPFAYHIVKGASTVSGTWTWGSSNWNATGITSTIVNVAVLPSRPQTS